MATIFGTTGDDTLDGDQNGSTLAGLGGDDTLNGSNGRDSLYGGTGEDSLTGGNNNDELYGGDDDDALNGGNSNDTMFGGSGDDSLDGENGSDSIFGGIGNDSIDAGSSRDTVYGGDGDDSVFGNGGEDYIEGGIGDDSLDGGQGQDTVFGGDGNDFLSGGDLSGNDGQDTLFGGAGDDTFDANGSQDSLYGGDGNDVFLLANDGSNFNNIYIDGNENSDDSDTDVLDLSAYFEADPDTQIVYEQGAEGDESGVIRLESGSGQQYGRITYTNIETITTTPICFTPGTMIATPKGEVAIENLRVGDGVFTRDNGMQDIRWIGRRDLGPHDMIAHQNFQPVAVRVGALGHGFPVRDLVLSPNHRLLLTGPRASLYFGENEVLVAAKHMVGMAGVDQMTTGSVSYIHMLFDVHEVVLSNGAWSESFQPGSYSLKGIGDAQRSEIFALFPELRSKTGLEGYQSARRALKKHEAHLLVQ